MKKKFNIILIVTMAIFLGILNVNAHEVKKIEAGEKFCIEKHPNFSKYYAYSWREGYTNDTWPGIQMKQDPNNSNVYCFTDTADAVTYQHDRIIFNNQGQPQTIDLNTVGGGLVYVIESTSGNYQGSWYVYDRSALIDLVTKTQNFKEEDYTIASYQNLLSVLNGNNNTVGAIELATRTYADYARGDNNPFILKSRDGRNGFDSQYETVYNALVAADIAMVKRAKIVVKSVDGGVVTSNYAENSDTKVILTSNPNAGRRLSKLNLTEITGYDNQGNPVLGSSLPGITVNDETLVYEYTLTTSDVYVEPVYEQIQYKLSFTIGENGVVYDEEDNEVGAPIQVYYNDNYTLRIVANEGYEIDNVVINGSTYELKDGELIIKNIVQDTGVEVSFKLIEYTIKVDGKEYKVTHGTKYEQLVNLINPEKEGYTFKGLKSLDGKTLEDSYVVESDNELTIIYEKNPVVEEEKEDTTKHPETEIKENPNTGDSIVKYVVILSLSIFGLIALAIIKLRKKTL